MGHGDNIARPTIGEIINTITSQMTMAFPDEDREATASDVVVMLQTITVVVKAYISKGLQ